MAHGNGIFIRLRVLLVSFSTTTTQKYFLLTYYCLENNVIKCMLFHFDKNLLSQVLSQLKFFQKSYDFSLRGGKVRGNLMFFKEVF